MVRSLLGGWNSFENYKISFCSQNDKLCGNQLDYQVILSWIYFSFQCKCCAANIDVSLLCHLFLNSMYTCWIFILDWIKVNFALIIMKYTVHLPFYLTQLSLLLRAVNKLCLQLSVKDSVVSSKMGGELYISLWLEQNSPLAN